MALSSFDTVCRLSGGQGAVPDLAVLRQINDVNICDRVSKFLIDLQIKTSKKDGYICCIL